MQGTRHLAARSPLSDSFSRMYRYVTGRVVIPLSLASALTLLGGCATTSTAPPTSAQEATAVPTGSALGTWQGTTTSQGNGIRKITLRMTQTGADVSGDYSCEAGNTACRNLNDSGTLSGKVTGNSLSVRIVMSPDNSQCFYTGRLAESLIFGTYQCLAEGRIVEIGSWRVKRVG
jgi:hypothetical protein